MRPRLDPSTRTVLEPASEPGAPRPLDAPPAGFVELFARSTFSGVTIEGLGSVEGASLLDAEDAWPGAGKPEEIVARAALFAQDVVSVVGSWRIVAGFRRIRLCRFAADWRSRLRRRVHHLGRRGRGRRRACRRLPAG